jgi:hypothetical protein
MTGFTDRQWDEYMMRRRLAEKLKREPLPQPRPLKQFKKKNPEIPVLDKYKDKLPAAYWSKWTKRSYSSLTPVRSWIDPEQLEKVAEELQYKDKQRRLGKVLSSLREGADIGCRGLARLPTSVRNSASAYEYGERVTDALQDWVKDGLAFGPMLPEEMPWSDYTVNPITVKIKPNGSARICINMSAPYAKDSDVPGLPASVNSGIDSDLFPATMSSTRKFCMSLARAGCPAEMIKVDWQQGMEISFHKSLSKICKSHIPSPAYKHTATRPEDHPLQVFSYGGEQE